MASTNLHIERRTFRISFDNGVISGGGKPGWLVEWPTDSGTWEPIDAPFGPFPGLEVDSDTQPEDVAPAIRALNPEHAVVGV